MNDGAMVRFGHEPYAYDVRTVAAVGVPPDFSRHAHASWIVGLVERGRRRMSLPGGEFDVPGGGIYIIPPDTPHACVPLGPPPHAHRAVCLSGQTFRDLAGTADRDVSDDAPGGAAAWLRRFFELVDADAPAQARRTALAEALGALSGLAAATVQFGPPGPSGPSGPSGRAGSDPAAGGLRVEVERAASYLAGQARRNPSLDETARHAGLSPFHLHRLFVARFGLAPHAFVMRHRLRLALAALEAGHSVVQAATLAGFADQSHFSRQFRRAVGIPPGRFVRLQRQPNSRPGARSVPSA
ncbi:MAG: AraC family transcriptional regulator [Desulfovibrionaceae bacterium]|nr:AraC family transcriptional regulator [Desulfovibrionaceae bacterium]